MKRTTLIIPLGSEYGRLTVTEDFGRVNGRRMLKCKCDCGNEKIINWDALKSGFTKSCGCLQIESAGTINKKHGLYKHPLYRIWGGMISRCYNKKNKAYKNYGAIGVTVCNEWKNNPESFIDWAIKNGWVRGLDIDKDKFSPIGSAKVYCPEYCCFLNRQENMTFTSHARLIEYNGEVLSTEEWGRRFNKKGETITLRLKRGLSIEEALTLPKIISNKYTKKKTA